MYIGAPIDREKTARAKSLGIPIDKRIGNRITPMAITDPTPYADTKIKQVTKETKIAAIIGRFFPTLLVAAEIEGAIPLSTNTCPNQEPKTM